ncbi:hypothetical protein ACFC58_10765 [Kitasatospora purpeofusca]|uniref:hypothetical protein n=1 Tax=Kitasatospora purpeofusca TaxID=67352 RepID=UPI0035DC8E44
MPSRMRGGRRGLAAVAGLVFTVGLALTGCDPTAADTATVAVTTPAAPVTTPPAAAPAVTTPAAAPVQTPPPAPAPTAVVPEPTKPAADPAPVVPVAPTTVPPKAQPTTSKAAPQPKATTAQPPTDPTPAETKPPVAAAGDCEIKSNAGNCYKAGQFCRDADLGKSTHEAGGRVITCRMVSGKPHWQA